MTVEDLEEQKKNKVFLLQSVTISEGDQEIWLKT